MGLLLTIYHPCLVPPLLAWYHPYILLHFYTSASQTFVERLKWSEVCTSIQRTLLSQEQGIKLSSGNRIQLGASVLDFQLLVHACVDYMVE